MIIDLNPLTPQDTCTYIYGVQFDLKKEAKGKF